MKDTNSNGLGRGEQQILKNLTSSVKKKQMTSFDRDILMSKIHSTLTYDQQFSKADIVIEAVFEDLKIKHKVLAEVESVVGPNTVFASNTSALPIGDIAAASKRPDKVIISFLIHLFLFHSQLFFLKIGYWNALFFTS